MLILSRKTHQAIIIRCGHDQVRLKIVQVGRDRVWLGLEAPEDVKILREELEFESDAG
jgi:carbon storage regulator CsrA